MHIAILFPIYVAQSLLISDDVKGSVVFVLLEVNFIGLSVYIEKSPC
jgi:uncharacterized protein (DUF983 family)